MASLPDYRLTVEFDATTEQVWDLLVNPTKVKAYMYGCDIETSWEPGTPLLWYVSDGKGGKLLAIKGNITAFEPGRKLAYTMLPPAMDLPDEPNSYITAAFEVEAAGAQTKLHITQSGYNTEALGEKRRADTEKGWQAVVPLMEKVLLDG